MNVHVIVLRFSIVCPFSVFFFLMIRRPTRSTRTDTLFPYTTLFRSYDQRIEVFCARGLTRAGNVHENTIETWGEDGAASAPLQNFFLDRYAQAYRAEIGRAHV